MRIQVGRGGYPEPTERTQTGMHVQMHARACTHALVPAACRSRPAYIRLGTCNRNTPACVHASVLWLHICTHMGVYDVFLRSRLRRGGSLTAIRCGMSRRAATTQWVTLRRWSADRSCNDECR